MSGSSSEREGGGRRRPAPAQDAGTDWLSALPDDLIFRIMSSMSARLAVQTCVLSRRWRGLWRAVPRVNADFCEFHRVTATDAGDEVVFRRFVDRLLELRDPAVSIDKFWLRYPVCDGNNLRAASADANRWISHALGKNARSVEVVVLHHTFLVDHAVLTSRFLTRIGFSTVLLARGFFKQLETGCPALEDLFLSDCIFLDDEISSKTVKILNIEIPQFFEEDQTSVSTPSATSMTLCCPAGRVPLLKDMKSVVTASVLFNHQIIGCTAADISQFLSSLSTVRSLEFTYKGKTLSIQNNMQWCPEFINLVSLTLGQWCLDANFYALIAFLQNSPRLEKLTLELADILRSKPEPERIIGELKERSFTCERLKIVQVICMEDDPLVNRVEGFFSNSDMTSLRINIKHWSQIRRDEPEFFRSEYM